MKRASGCKSKEKAAKFAELLEKVFHPNSSETNEQTMPRFSLAVRTASGQDNNQPSSQFY